MLTYSAETRTAFAFTGPATKPYQRHFAERLARLCQKRGTRLVVLHLPQWRERELPPTAPPVVWRAAPRELADVASQETIPEREPWPEVWPAPVDLVGIPFGKLFGDLPATDLPRLFVDNHHFNQNGQELFTKLITPTLLKLYAAPTNSLR